MNTANLSRPEDTQRDLDFQKAANARALSEMLAGQAAVGPLWRASLLLAEYAEVLVNKHLGK